MKNDLFLPGFCLRGIYENTLFINSALMPVGWIFDKVRYLASGRDNETHDDTYENVYLTSVELVDPGKLSKRYFRKFTREDHLKNGPLYLGTFVSIYSDGISLKWRQSVMNGGVLKKLGIKAPTADIPTGDGKSVIAPFTLDITTKGPYWGPCRPRTQFIEMAKAAEETLGTVNKMLADPTTIVRSSPLPKFASPPRTVTAIALGYAVGLALKYRSLFPS